MIKRFSLLCLIAVLSTVMFFVISCLADPAFSQPSFGLGFIVGSNVYYADGQPVTMDATPFISGGHALVPVRYLANALGAQTAWDEAAQTITVTELGTTILLTIGSTSLAVNGQTQTMDVAPTISNGRTYVPACYIAEALGYNVSWDSSNQAVIIATSKPGAAGQVLGLLNAMKNPVFADSKQVLTVTSQYPSSQHATVNAYEKINGRWTLVYANMRSLIGQNGMVNDAERRQDTNTTPSGIYDIVFAFGWAANPGTKLPYRLADNNSYWDENSGSPTYNRWVESNPGGDNEQLKNQPLYKYAMVLDFNWNQQPQKGAGIFIHINPSHYTDGCVGLDEPQLVKIMRWLDPAKNPKVLIAPMGAEDI